MKEDKKSVYCQRIQGLCSEGESTCKYLVSRFNTCAKEKDFKKKRDQAYAQELKTRGELLSSGKVNTLDSEHNKHADWLKYYKPEAH